MQLEVGHLLVPIKAIPKKKELLAMSEFSDVAAMFSSKHSARILLQHRTSVGSVDGDSDVRSLSTVDAEPASYPDKAPVNSSRPVPVFPDRAKPALSLQQVKEQLAALEHAPMPTKEEIQELVAQQSESSESDESSSVFSSDESATVILKVLIVGNARCGKTSTIRRFTRNDFHDEYVSTIGADFEEKILQYDQQLSISLQLWDIAGQDRFAKLTRGYFREAKGAVIVCDITRANTLDAVVTWKHEIDTCCQDLNEGADIPVVMVANKSDLLTDPMGALDLGVNMQKCVEKNHIVEWFRASAKSGEHIDDAFQCLIDRMVKNYYAQKEKDKKRMDDDTVKEERSGTPEIIRLSTPPQYRAVKQHGFACDCK